MSCLLALATRAWSLVLFISCFCSFSTPHTHTSHNHQPLLQLLLQLSQHNTKPPVAPADGPLDTQTPHLPHRQPPAAPELPLFTPHPPHLQHPPAAPPGGRPACYQHHPHPPAAPSYAPLQTSPPHLPHPPAAPAEAPFTPHPPHLSHPPAAPAGGRPARTNTTQSQRQTAPSPWRGAPAEVELRVLLR